MADLVGLAERAEAAAGPDRALDIEIGRAIDFLAGTRASYELQSHMIPHYTSSLDAAMTLVPEGWGGKLFFSENRPDRELHCSATLARSYPTNAKAYSEKSGKDGDRSAMPLALVAAALRARATTEGGSHG